MKEFIERTQVLRMGGGNMSYVGIINYYGSKAYIGQIIKNARIRRRITIRELAEETGYNKATIVNIEKGAYCARVDILHNIANTLGIDITIGTLPTEAIDILKHIDEDLYMVVVGWCRDNWYRRPADNEDLLHQYRNLSDNNKGNIDYLEDTIGEMETYILLSHCIDSAVRTIVE